MFSENESGVLEFGYSSKKVCRRVRSGFKLAQQIISRWFTGIADSELGMLPGFGGISRFGDHDTRRAPTANLGFPRGRLMLYALLCKRFMPLSHS